MSNQSQPTSTPVYLTIDQWIQQEAIPFSLNADHAEAFNAAVDKLIASMGDEVEILGVLIEHYENEHFPIGLPSPVDAIKFRMEQLGYNQSDLATIFGVKSRASEVLNKKRKLSLEMIRQLHAKLNIPTEVLIQAY